MKILVLNGSPKGNESNTLRITNQFLEGISSTDDHQIKFVAIKDLNIENCIGCFSCWTKSPGKCIFNDDMNFLLDEYINSDLIIWSFPLYYFSMPSKIKAFMDRLLPLNLPYMNSEVKNGASHVERFDTKNKKYVLISTCGFHSRENNYEALEKQFEILYGKDKLTKIICTEGELLKVEELNYKTKPYLDNVYEAGKEYALHFKLSEETNQKLKELFFPPETFVKMANDNWDISHSDEKKSQAETLLRQMKNIYNPKHYKTDSDSVLEFYFTDLKEKYQLILNKKECVFQKSNFSEYTTKIETSFSLWSDISKGKIKGDEALAQGKYKVLGDIQTMMNLNLYFGKEDSMVQSNELKTNMFLIFLPWIFFWTIINFNGKIAGILAIVVSSLLPILSGKYKSTIYDKLSAIFCSIFGLLSLLNYFRDYLYATSFGLMGAMWLMSAFNKVPLTAEYSINNFEDKTIKENYIFLRTNRILTVMWGIAYFFMGVFSTLSFSGWTKLLLNNLFPLALLIFTNYFAKEYPKYLMTKNTTLENII